MGQSKYRLTIQVGAADRPPSVQSSSGWGQLGTNTLSLFALLQAGLCLVGCLQLVAFTSLLFQLPHLYGRHGVQPISTVLEAAQRSKPGTAAW